MNGGQRRHDDDVMPRCSPSSTVDSAGCQRAPSGSSSSDDDDDKDRPTPPPSSPLYGASSSVGGARCTALPATQTAPSSCGSSHVSRVVAEIIDTERKYVRDLRQIVHVSHASTLFTCIYCFFSIFSLLIHN